MEALATQDGGRNLKRLREIPRLDTGNELIRIISLKPQCYANLAICSNHLEELRMKPCLAVSSRPNSYSQTPSPSYICFLKPSSDDTYRQAMSKSTQTTCSTKLQMSQ